MARASCSTGEELGHLSTPALIFTLDFLLCKGTGSRGGERLAHVNKMRSIHTREYFSTVKKKKTSEAVTLATNMKEPWEGYAE